MTVLKIGDYLCDILSNSDSDNNIYDFWYSYVKCRVSPLMPSGLYMASMSVIDGYGDSQRNPTLRKISRDNVEYNMAVIPIVESLSSYSGSRKGQIISIKGRGFNMNANFTRVSVDNQLDCVILSITIDTIVCELQEDLQNIAQNLMKRTVFAGGSGADYRKFKLSGETVSQMKATNGFPENYVYKDRYFELETPQNM